MNSLGLVVALAALVLGAWVRAAAAAVSEVPRADAHHDAAAGKRGARRIADLLEDRRLIMPAAGMVGTILLVLATALGVVVAAEGSAPSLLATLWVLLVVVGVGDVLPRLLGRRHPQRIAYASSRLLQLTVKAGGWAAESEVGDNGEPPNGLDDEDDVEEIAMISSVLEFSDTIVREVMVPRVDMVTVDVDTPIEGVVDVALANGYSRLPVTEGDDVVGVLLVKDLLAALAGRSGGFDLRAVMRPVMFVPEVKPISDLLAEMRASRTHLSMVVDEFGDIVGLVTIEDLLEELVGEIADETDDEETWIEPLGEGRWRVDARLPVEELAELAQVELPEGEWDTVAGLVLGLAERVPTEEETFVVDDMAISVSRMQGRRIAEVLVTRLPIEADQR